MHWVRGQCKKGDNCEYLHVYDKEKLPVCKFLKDHGNCQKGDQCQFRHEMTASDFIHMQDQNSYAN